MPERTVTIASSVGLHARPASLFSQAAAKAGVPVTLTTKAGKSVNAAEHPRDPLARHRPRRGGHALRGRRRRRRGARLAGRAAQHRPRQGGQRSPAAGASRRAAGALLPFRGTSRRRAALQRAVLTGRVRLGRLGVPVRRRSITTGRRPVSPRTPGQQGCIGPHNSIHPPWWRPAAAARHETTQPTT